MLKLLIAIEVLLPMALKAYCIELSLWLGCVANGCLLGVCVLGG